MKIVLLNDDAPPEGKSSVAQIVGALEQQYRSMGHDVTVLTTHNPSISPHCIRDARKVSIPSKYEIKFRQYASLYRPNISATLHRELRELKPDIIHAHNIHIHLTYDALRIARRHTNKVFLTLHDVMTFSSVRLASDRYLNSNGKDTRVTWQDHWKGAGLQWNPFHHIWVRRILRKHPLKVFAVSKALSQALKANNVPCHEIVHNGIEAGQWHVPYDKIKSFKKEADLENAKIVFFSGRISKDKGVEPLIQAMQLASRRVQNAVLLVAGDPERWRRATAHLYTTNLRIHLAGWLSPEQMRIAMAASDIVTVPSLCLDCFPSTNLEAMAASKPVITTIFGGSQEAIRNEKDGFIINPNHTQEFAEKIIELLLDDNLRSKMGNAGYQHVRDFSLERQAMEYLKHYTEAAPIITC